MISRRKFGLFGVSGLGFVLVSRWPFLVRQKQPDRILVAHLSLSIAGQPPEPQQMAMREREDGSLYYGVGRCRLEYPKKQIVDIYCYDLNKRLTLDLRTHEYTVGSIDRGVETLDTNSASEKSKPNYLKLLPYDPSLFEVPANFKLKQ